MFEEQIQPPDGFKGKIVAGPKGLSLKLKLIIDYFQGK